MNFSHLAPHPRKTRSIRHLGPIDIATLKAAVLQIPEELWEAENAVKPNQFGTLGTTQHILFKMVSDFVDWRRSYETPLWNEWRPLLEPVLSKATEPYGYSNAAFPRIMLARMAPGGVIQPHRDTNPAAKWPHKIHVPLVTNPAVRFLVGGAWRHLAEGEAVEVNNLDPHAVRNDGMTPRIHLIFEYYDADQRDPDWINPLRDEFANA